MVTDGKMPVWPGWETVRLIGRGSFGEVYEIRRDVFGDTERAALKHVAIPQNDSEIEELRSSGYDEANIRAFFTEQVRSLVNEYKMMRRLSDCPYVVESSDLEYSRHEDGLGWDVLIRMELLTPLTKAIRADPAEREAQAIRLGKDLCRALAACGRANIIHRDIKPANIFLSDRGQYKLGDFGIARIKEQSATATARIGTFFYMAPEVYAGRKYDARADIYSLGVVLYWMLNDLHVPFLLRNTLKEREQALQRRLRGEPLPPLTQVSEALSRIVLKACAFAPGDRYISAEEMLFALENMDADEEPTVPLPKKSPDPVAELLHRARKYKEKPDYIEMIRLLEDAARLEPENIEVLSELAWANRQLNRQDAAEALYRQILHISGKNTQACVDLGELLLGQHRDREAAEAFEKAAGSLPQGSRERVQAAMRGAKAWAKAGKLDRAEALWNDAAKNGGDPAEIENERQRYGRRIISVVTDHFCLSVFGCSVIVAAFYDGQPRVLETVPLPDGVGCERFYSDTSAMNKVFARIRESIPSFDTSAKGLFLAVPDAFSFRDRLIVRKTLDDLKTARFRLVSETEAVSGFVTHYSLNSDPYILVGTALGTSSALAEFESGDGLTEKTQQLNAKAISPEGVPLRFENREQRKASGPARELFLAGDTEHVDELRRETAPLAKKVKSLGAECVALGLCVIAGTQRGLCDTLVLSGIPMYDLFVSASPDYICAAKGSRAFPFGCDCKVELRTKDTAKLTFCELREGQRMLPIASLTLRKTELDIRDEKKADIRLMVDPDMRFSLDVISADGSVKKSLPIDRRLSILPAGDPGIVTDTEGPELQALLDMVDELHRAVDSIPASDISPHAKGLRLLYQKALGSLSELGVEMIEAEGRPFDPQLHNALVHTVDPALTPGVVKKVIKPGYRYKGKLLRCSDVVVAN